MKSHTQALLLVVYALVFTCPAALVSAEEDDPLKKRVPFGVRSEVEVMKNPMPKTPETVAKGKAVFEGKGFCYKCHGPEGKGNGRLAPFLDPSPRNFTNVAWQKDRSDGELLWIIKNGSEGTGMASMAPSEISVEEAWQVITYIRALGNP
jgi:mono/diheme cytochrome c family protein